ncbi:MAG: hypothetical protein V1792_28365, partial [Pseudomonadota bacterium]
GLNAAPNSGSPTKGPCLRLRAAIESHDGNQVTLKCRLCHHRVDDDPFPHRPRTCAGLTRSASEIRLKLKPLCRGEVQEGRPINCAVVCRRALV